MSTSSFRRRAVIAGGALLAVALAACAGRTAAPDAVPAARGSTSREPVVRRPDTPPRVLSQAQPLRITRVVRVPAGGQSPGAMGMRRPDLSYSVVVGTDGQPDLSTLRVTGDGGREDREAITQWLLGVKFAPALLDGVPVRAEFRVDR